MEKTIGQMIGKIEHTFETTLDSGEKVRLTVTFDFTHSPDDMIRSWLVGNRVIAFQRPVRPLALEEAKKLNGRTIAAHNAGKKIESREQQIRKLEAIGLPRKIAELAVDNPDKLEELVK